MPERPDIAALLEDHKRQADTLAAVRDAASSWSAFTHEGLALHITAILDASANSDRATRQLRECTICGEKVPVSHATSAWEARHEHPDRNEVSQ